MIYLNTETRDFSFPPLEIRCPRVELSALRPLAWSDRLRRCLDVIPYEIVLYLQEDYFVKGPVDTAMLDELVDLMLRDSLSHISLVPDDRPGTQSEYPFLDCIAQRAEYRVTAQAGLWRIPSLRSYLRRHETVWEFEWYGTRRARRKRDSFFYVNAAYEHSCGNQVIPYNGTGVVHGRWCREIVEDLFATHGIPMDFSSRGFYEGEHHVRRRKPWIVRGMRRLRSAF